MLKWSKKSWEIEKSKVLSPSDDQDMHKCIEAFLIILCSVRNLKYAYTSFPVFMKYPHELHRSDACLVEILMPNIQYKEIDLN
jgi:hypothetical protein